MFLTLKRRGYRKIGPVGIAFAAYRTWKRLSPTQQEKIKQRGRALRSRLRPRRTTDAPKPY